ncbi:hypothetical protein UMM65_10240 [Aureibaculum sp. 2210JD6-5]|uniref:hypothetical protein n=1 Tax=Aureibaculum sp. 2210JD6-5 TaxID=3103957 RepID=UPI002AADE292|nr:hypothetical protein [Aureibaculum sp. 2210JD6-5]MDY7395622.1 hypothetical protein [Aureibaculum sp. 2210JD6-5]
MDTTEKNIKKLLINNNELKSIDVNLEDNIMDKINSQKDYKVILVKTKRKAKVGIFISLLLFVVYGIVTYVELLASNSYGKANLTNFYPTLFASLVVIVVYIEITFGVVVFRKSLPN